MSVDTRKCGSCNFAFNSWSAVYCSSCGNRLDKNPPNDGTVKVSVTIDEDGNIVLKTHTPSGDVTKKPGGFIIKTRNVVQSSRG